MNLGLKNNEVRLVEYSPKWRGEFERSKNLILNHTHIPENRIEHIGSTSIIGMSAKPIIDIVIGVDDLKKVDKTLFKELEKAGFFRLKVNRPNEIVLAKFLDESYKVKTHFIHLVEYKKDLWHNLIFFRDYLNSNKEDREKYLDIKKKYVSKSSTGIIDYTNYKENFVKEIYKKRK
ncbi:MAG TPA: GrpB family protein [Candidatus Nosocomiicoccus stercorigallinarum]|nr:GrpB family protein [Candidatus Nosocomiicoccus stercorigallinarum]